MMNTPIEDLFALAEEAIAPVIRTEKKALQKFKESATPERVREVAEAFRAMEQRAEAAEKESARLADWVKCVEAERDKNIAWHSRQLKRAEAAEAKLAEFEKQKPVGDFYEDGPGNWWQIGPHDKVPHVTPLFRRPAPTINLAELVPEGKLSLNNGVIGWDEGWNACRTEILRSTAEMQRLKANKRS